MKNTSKIAVVVTTILCLCVPAHATYEFKRITANNATDIAGQLSVEVSHSDSNLVLFTFHNNGPNLSSIADIYFDTGTAIGLLDEIVNITSEDDVKFKNGVTHATLPGGNIVGFTSDLSATADKSPIKNGVNPGESVTLHLSTVWDFDDVINALYNGNLRIGLHVQSIAPDGNSDSFINVPTPATVLLMGMGTLFTFGLPRR